MMRNLLVFSALFFDAQYGGVLAQAATQSAVWTFPTANNPLTANYGDTVLLDYTSTLNNTILRMWCAGSSSQNLASSFYVNANGPFAYILSTYAPDQTGFPLSCHAELAADPLGSGTDSPAGITFSSKAGQVAKTISQSQAVSASIVTTTVAGPTTVYITSIKSSPTGSSNPTSSAPATTSPVNPSVAAVTSPPSASQSATLPQASSSSNNTGAIVGGVIGGLALLTFIIFGLLFLRRHRRNNAPGARDSTVTEPSKSRFSLFGFYQKRGGQYSAANVHEKEGESAVVHEKDGNHLPHSARVHEVPGSTATYELPAGPNYDIP